MDSSANKAIMIGAALMITIIVASGILFTVNQIKEIYSQVYETDTSIKGNFSEFEKYDNTSKTGVDLLNTVKKYLNNPEVRVTYSVRNGGTQNTVYTDDDFTRFKNNFGGSFEDMYNYKYKVTLEDRTINKLIVKYIIFNKVS